MINIFRTIRNSIDYPLRHLFHWRKRGLRIANEEKNNLFADLPERYRSQAENDEARLRSDYQLNRLYEQSSCGNYRENLFYLEMLSRAFSLSNPVLPDELNAVDIGPSHWFYVQAQYNLLTYWGCQNNKRKVFLEAFETDPYRVYTDLHSRIDHALAHIGDLTDVTYHPLGFSPQPGKYNVIFMLFPFVFPNDHLEWGLPRSHFDPEKNIQFAWESLRSDGFLIIANQGKEEHKEQLHLLAKNNMTVTDVFRHESLFFTYQIPRYIIICNRSSKNG